MNPDVVSHDYKNVIKSIAARFYIHSLKSIAGTTKINRIGKLFKGKRSDQFVISLVRSLYRYEKGDHIRNAPLLDAVDAEFPGSARIARHPLWLIMENPLSSLDEIYSYMQLLSPDLVNKLFQMKHTDSIPKRKELNFQGQLDSIIQRVDLDGLACLLMIIREMELLKRIDPYIGAKWAARHTLSLLAQHESFLHLGDSIYDLIYRDFIGRNDPLPQHMKTKICRYFPRSVECPLGMSDFHYSHCLNRTILFWGHRYGMLEDDERENNRFLYLSIKNGPRDVVEETLLSLPTEFHYDNNWKSLPKPLDTIMYLFSGDRRSSINRSPFFD